MTEPTETQPQGNPAPVATEPAPAEPAQPATEPAPADVESIVNARLSEWEEKRIKPLQREISERDEQIKKLKTASMSEEEREQLEIEERNQYVADLEVRAWLAEKSAEDREVAEAFRRILQTDDPEAQWAAFKAIMRPAAPTPEEPDESTQVPDVNPNNPAPRTVSQAATMDVDKMSADMRRQILSGAVFERP